MAERVATTDIYLVPDLRAAFHVAGDLGARAVGLDMEGVVGNYVGNDPYQDSLRDFMSGQGVANVGLTGGVIRANPDTAYGIITNNTNKPFEDGSQGLVTQVAGELGIAPSHTLFKGMQVEGASLRSKPSGDLSRYFCETTGVDPQETVLIDDQGIKNAGEAIQAELKAIIVPTPIGLPDRRGGVVEHPWVRRSRKLESAVYGSLETKGGLARVAYRLIAGVDVRQIAELHDYRRLR